MSGGEQGWTFDHRYCASALLSLIVLSCSANERAVPPAPPAAAQPGRTGASESVFGAWLHGPTPVTAKRVADSPQQPIGAACISHVGCEISAPTLPACTPPSALPAGYVSVQGELALSSSVLVYGVQGVLACVHVNRTNLTVKNATAEYDLGIGCMGDRTGWCCPYALGTTVHAVGRVASDRDVLRLSDYWMCAESAPKVAGRTPSSEPIALRLGQPPGFATWALGTTLATWDFEHARSFQIRSDNQKPFVCVDFDPTGKRAFTVDRAGDGAVWALATGAREATLQSFAPGARTQPFAPDVSCTYELAESVTWAPDGGALLLVSTGGNAAVYTPGSSAFQALPSQIPVDNSHYEYFAPGGRELLIGTQGGPLELWQTEPLRKRLSLTGTAGAWLPDGKQLLIRVDAGVGSPVNYQVRDAADGTLRAQLKGACLAEWSPNARYIAAQRPCGTDSVELLDVTTGRTLAKLAAFYRPLWSGRRTAPPQYVPYLAQFLERGFYGRSAPLPVLSPEPARNLLAAANIAGVTLLNANGQRTQLKGEIRSSSDAPKNDPALDFSPDGKSLVAGSRLWSLNVAGATRAFDLPADVTFLQKLWSPDSLYLASWNWIQTDDEPFKTSAVLVVVARDSGRVLVSERPSANAASHQRVVGLLSPSWLPDKPVLVVPVPGNDQLLELWNVAHGTHLWFALDLDQGQPSMVALSSDGRFEGRRELLIRMQSQHPELQTARELREEHGLLDHFLNE